MRTSTIHPQVSGHEVKVLVHVQTVSEANRRGAWGKHYGRTKQQRESTAKHLLTIRAVAPPLPVTVTLTRHAPRMLDEGDNLPVSMKSIRDEVAWFYCVDDRDPLITWDYAQAKSKTYGVEIRIVAIGGKA